MTTIGYGDITPSTEAGRVIRKGPMGGQRLASIIFDHMNIHKLFFNSIWLYYVCFASRYYWDTICIENKASFQFEAHKIMVKIRRL